MKKVLILVLAYNAEKHIVKVLDRMPPALWNNDEYTAEIVVIDDCSKDETSRVARQHFGASHLPIRLLRNERNQGYGGNQKVGYTYAIKHGFDAVVMVHGDGQYPPEKIPDMVGPLIRGECQAVFGSRMMVKQDALAGGMPYYKFAGNITLTRFQNAMLGSNLTEFHSGFRAYSVDMLKRIPFEANSNVFHFDTDIIIQMVDCGFVIKEIPIPTHYGDEVCHVNGMRYAADVMAATVLSRIQKFGIFYAPKFDYRELPDYADKSAFASSHRFALDHIEPGLQVLDITYGGEGHVAAHLRKKGCKVVGCAVNERLRDCYDELVPMDPSRPDFSVLGTRRFDVILLLDVVEKVHSPEQFLDALYNWCNASKPRILVTVPNIAYFVQRIMHLLGQFNYGKRGTLDMTHTRLFTYRSIQNALSNAGFNVNSEEGIPAPFPVALGDKKMAQFLLKLNAWFIRVSRKMFSYQIAVVAEPRPTLETLVQQAIASGEKVK